MAWSLTGVKYGAAHYKSLEQDKINAFKISKGWFDAMIILSQQSIIHCWYNTTNSLKIILRKVNLLLKFHLMQVVLGGELSATIFALESHITLTKRNTILILRNFWQLRFLWKYLQKYLMHMLSCYKTTLLLFMASVICTLINLSCYFIIYEIWAWAKDKNI